MAADKVTTFKIYVGNLPDDTSDEDVRKIFEEFGTVVQCVCFGKKAFVHMEDDIEGKFAIGELQGRELSGNALTIEESRKNELPKMPTVKLSVKNISPSVDARGLRNMFKKFGYVIEVQIENGEGYVCLEAIGDIRSAINEMNGYKMDDMELSVEPAQISNNNDTVADEPESSKTSSPKKNKKGKGFGNWQSSWSRAQPETDYYASEYDHGDFSSYDSYSPWVNPPHSPFDPQPERILRDPHRHRRPFGRPAGPRGFPGPMPMGHRGMPPRMMHPPRHHFPGPPMGGMPGRVMRSGVGPRGLPPRGGGPRLLFRNNPFPPEPFYGRDQVPRNFVQEEEECGEEVFYEDEPITTVSRSKPPPRMSATGANSMPLGSVGSIPRNPWSNFSRPNNPRGGRGRGGMGRGKFPRFTAVTDDVSPGEKYPVPPSENPGFRAPIKRGKEEVKRKIKKKKKPLVPAELPDYSVPVPELPRGNNVPKGAVLKPFPPPQGHSVMDSDTFGGHGSTNFFQTNDNPDNGNHHMDFTTDDVV